MRSTMSTRPVITGIGLITPLGFTPDEVLRRIAAGETAATAPAFDAAPFSCQVCAPVRNFEPQRYVAEAKLLRLMNREAQFSVAAAHLALQDARLEVGRAYAPADIALFGATGLAGLPLGEVGPLLRASITPEGRFDPARFGQSGLRSISPLLSFKILGTRPLCFVSICENIQGENAIYTPWENQGVQAIVAGCAAIASGRARCALVGGCDVKTHELAFLALEQLGVFASWRETGAGFVPGEGAAYLVLEAEDAARQRGAHLYARLAQSSEQPLTGVIAAANGNRALEQDEATALVNSGVAPCDWLQPKKSIGDLFAAAAAVQVALGAVMAEKISGAVLARCAGFRSEPAAFVLEHA